jgi:hypothetical protein
MVTTSEYISLPDERILVTGSMALLEQKWSKSFLNTTFPNFVASFGLAANLTVWKGASRL